MIDGAINQDPVWPITSLKLAADEVLLAVADRVDTNHALRRASRIVLKELTKVVWEHPKWLQGGFVANGYLCHMLALVSEKLADNPRPIRDWGIAIPAGQLKHLLTESYESFH